MGLFRKAGIVVVGAVGIKLANPFLDELILPNDVKQFAKEAEEKYSSKNKIPFDPNQTDVLAYQDLGFLKPQVERLSLDIGTSFILSQSMPRWFVYLVEKAKGNTFFQTNVNEDKYEKHTVDILDARKRRDELSFEKNGFTLLQMDEPSKTTSWRSPADIALFQEELRPQLMELYPGAARIEFTSHVVRGGTWLGDQPAAIDGPHLDYTQDDQERAKFHETYPINEIVKEHLALSGQWDTEEDEMQALLGIWKPIHMKDTPIYDHPLAIMDALTFKKEQERPHEIHIDFVVFLLHNLNAGFTFDESQKWYYYPYQTEQEVLVFTQYSKGKHFANPHSSFLVPNRPDEYQTRQSIELRAAVFFPRNRTKSA